MKKKAKEYGIYAVGFLIVFIMIFLFSRFFLTGFKSGSGDAIAVMFLFILLVLYWVSIPSAIYFTILAIYTQFRHTKPEVKKEVEIPFRDFEKQPEITFNDVEKHNDKIIKEKDMTQIYKRGIIASPIGIIFGFILTLITEKISIYGVTYEVTYPYKSLGEVIIVLFLIITLIFLFLYLVETMKQKSESSNKVLETLQMRYVKGEISKEEFERMKKDLED